MNLQNLVGNYCTNVLPTISTQKFAAIFGESPSKGARSPTLWNRAFNKLNIDAHMIPMDVRAGAFNDLMDELQKDKNFMGGAIAVPYKEAAWQWCGDRLPQEARNIGAVNCIYRGDNGALWGNNTDGAGAITSLKEKVGDLSEKRILVMGLGGTGKAVSAFLASEMADSKNLILTSRSDAAAKMALKLSCSNVSWEQRGFDLASVDIIINCTTLGSTGTPGAALSADDFSSFSDRSFVFDVIYDPAQTTFLRLASERNLVTLNGSAMNFEQAVMGFQLATTGSGFNATVSSVKSAMVA